MSHGNSGGGNSGYGNSGGHDHGGNDHVHSDGPNSHFHYAVGDNFNPLGNNSSNYKWEHLIDGLRISNGVRFAILFIAFFGWLYVVYWLRHHEPPLNQSADMSSVPSSSAKQDGSMMASIRNAFPFKTSEDSGKLYVPTAEPETVQSEYQKTEVSNRISVMPSRPGAAISAPLNYIDRDFDQRFGEPINIQSISNHASLSISEPLVANSVSNQQYSGQQANSSRATSPYPCNTPIHSGHNAMVRTVVNR